MQLMFKVLAVVSLLTGISPASAKDKLEPLNSTLIAKLHLDNSPGRGQMVGAYQFAFRPLNGGYINTLTVLLNPGLRIEKVVGAGNRDLAFTSSITPIAEMNGLELRVAEITLPSTLLGTNRTEIVIHYRGTLENLSRYGLEGVPDQLDPDFAMIRAKAFAYPVFANPNRSDIEQVWLETRMSQVAFIELPDTHTLAGSLQIREKTLSGSKINYELKASKPTSLMSMAIAPYNTLSDGPISIAYLRGSSASATTLRDQLNERFQAIEALLGAANKDASLQIVEVPADTQTLPSSTSVFISGSIPDSMKISDSMHSKIAGFWRINSRGRANHWADGLDQVIAAAVSDTLPIASEHLFQASKTALSANKAISKTPLEEFLTEGLEAEQAVVSGLAFAVLRDMLGEDDFFAVVRAIRAEAASGYADMAVIAEVLDSTIKNKAARKFAEGWFSGKKIGKALSKAATFAELVAAQR